LSGATESYLVWFPWLPSGKNGCQNAQNLMGLKVQMVLFLVKAFLMSLSGLLFIYFSLEK